MSGSQQCTRLPALNIHPQLHLPNTHWSADQPNPLEEVPSIEPVNKPTWTALPGLANYSQHRVHEK